MSPIRTSLALGLAAACAFASLSAHADDDRFTLRLGAINAKAETQLRAATEFGGEQFDFTSDRFDLGDEVLPRVEGMFRLGNRHRLLFNYLRYDQDRSATLSEDVSFDEVTLPAGSSATVGARFDLASLVYDFALVETPTASFGLQIGAAWSEVEGRVSARSGDDRFDSRARESGTAPVVGARLAANTADQKWRFVVQAQYLDADWGDFDDYEGDLSRANALVEYRFTESFGVFAGYDWFRLDVTRDDGDLRYGIDQRFRGPMAGVTLAF